MRRIIEDRYEQETRWMLIEVNRKKLIKHRYFLYLKSKEDDYAIRFEYKCINAKLYQNRESIKNGNVYFVMLIEGIHIESDEKNES